MSNPSWNSANFMQPGGGQGQQPAGGIKMFDPSQFAAPVHQQPQAASVGGPGGVDPQQQQNYMPTTTATFFNPQSAQGFQAQAGGQGSSWDSWGAWDWNTNRQNTELSGQQAANTNFVGPSGTSVEGAGGEQQDGNQAPQEQQGQYEGQFGHPQQYQNGGYHGGEGFQQQWHSTEHGNYYYDHSQGQWVLQPGVDGTQVGQDGSAQGQFYQGQQAQQAYFDPAAWNSTHSDHSAEHQQWPNNLDAQGQVPGFEHQQAMPVTGAGDVITDTQPAEGQAQPSTEIQDVQSTEMTGDTDMPQGVGLGEGGGASGLFVAPPSLDVTSSQASATQDNSEVRVGGHTRGSSIDSNVSGMATGLFGQGDSTSQSGGSAMSSPRRGGEGGAAALPTMQHLKVSNFQRTDSGISNASLQTVNLSADEDTKEAAEELAEQMGHMQLDGAGGGTAENPGGQQLYDHPGDFSGFGNYSVGPPQTEPALVQGSEATETRESDELSPVGNDWEIVPPQAQSSASHSRTSSVDEGIKFTAKPPHDAHADNRAAEPPNTSQHADSAEGNPVATHSSSTQDSESFTAISSSSGSVDTYSHSSAPFSDRGFQPPSATSTPFTSPGSQSVHSQISPLPNVQTSSPLAGRPPATVDTPASVLPSPSAKQNAPSASSSAMSLTNPKKTASHAQQSRSTGNILDSPSTASKAADISESKASAQGPIQRGKPPPSPGPRGGSRTSPEREKEANSSPRHRQSAFHPVHSHRAKHNMSPATTLWDNADPAPTGNILLAPAAPLIIPSLGTTAPRDGMISGTSDNTTTTASSSVPKPVGKSSSSGSLERMSASRRASERATSSRYGASNRRGSDRKDGERGGGRDRGEDLSRSRDEDSRSLGSLDELDAMPDYSDDSRDRSRGYRRDAGYDSYYERPSSRSEVGRDDFRRPRDPRDAYRGYGRDYRDPYYDERYDRPRSRQDEERSSRPSSRSGRELDRPGSRAEYERDRDAYYQHQREARYRGYTGYDAYGPDYYYDERERYYRYYTDSRYRRGYAEEMGYYGQYDRYAAYYGHHRPPSLPPADDLDHSSIASQSRGQTPAFDDSDTSSKTAKNNDKKDENQSSTDFYSRSSRPSSRMERERERDPYRQGYGGYGAYDPYAGYYDQYHQYGYPYYQYPQYGEQGYQQGRMTPPKYLLPHVRVCFGPTGQLVTVLPNRPSEGQPATVEIHDVQVMLQENPEAEELRAFPGPLVRNETHKNDVLLLCQKKAKECAENINMVDRESAELIWRLLELLLKQNGTIIGTDIADLLLVGHEPTTHEYTVSGMRIIPSADQLEATETEGSSRGSSPAVRTSTDRTVVSATQQIEEATDRFRHYLLYGRKKEALDWAMKRNLWGHALFLASKMDNRTHASVMTRFANTAMRMNDPLQTLYQLMSGRQPASVTNVVDERWGDWRPHLAMILSNHSSRPELDKKSIITLGDTLATKHCLHASHFCYLMAQVEFGSFTKKTSKIVLIGSNHNLPLDEFANNSAIQCTEVYEYAQSLGNSKFCLPQFQIYKFLYACRLAEFGLAQEAFHYCEIIAQQVLQFPARYRPSFVTILYTLASRLKLCDPQKLHEGYDSADPVWLQQLQGICQNYEEGSLQYKSGSATPAYGGMTPSSESGEVASYGMDAGGGVSSIIGGGGGGMYHQEGSAYRSGFSHQQPMQQPFGESAGHTEAEQVQPAAVTGTAEQYGQYDSNQYGQTAAGDQYNWQQQQQQQQQYDPSQYQQQWQNYDPSQAGTTQYSQGYGTEQNAAAQQNAAGMYGAGTAETGTEQQQQQQQYQQQQQQPGYGGFSGQQPPGPRGSLTDQEEVDEDDDGEDEDDVDSQPVNSASQFDYFGMASQQQQIVAPPHRYRSTSTSSTGSTSRRRRRTTSGSSTGSVRAANPSKPSAPAQKPPEPKKDSGQKSGGGGGWFLNGLFSKLGGRNKNEMILPDDKNPAIIWDPVKKRWVNKDGEEDETTVAAPPPKDADLIGKMAGPGGPAPPAASAGPVANGPPTGNRFSLGRGRGARGQYVDVLNPSGTTNTSVPTSLFNVLPPAGPAATSTAATPQLLNPSGAASGKSSSQTSMPSSQNNTLAPPSQDLSRSSSLSSLSREIQQLTMKRPPRNCAEGAVSIRGLNQAQELGDSDSVPAPALTANTNQAPAMPMMFNPSQLSSGNMPASGSAGPGLKYGNRRVYPK